MDKDLKKLIAAIEAEGYTTAPTRRGHVRVYRDGTLITTFSGTSSDWRGVRNSLAPLRRLGFNWPPKR
ncbi:MAG: hypothetical protein KBG77_06215 [Dermatophilaceae bacterium]|nr:hypothetical protein [Dermatophilaceae bacterium]